jgi:hypothetical protein
MHFYAKASQIFLESLSKIYNFVCWFFKKFYLSLQASWRHAFDVLEYSWRPSDNCLWFSENVKDLLIHL